MRRRDILTLALVAVLIAPAASAYAPSTNSSPDASDAGDAVQPSVTETPAPADETAASGSASSSTSASASASSSKDVNYTRLYIADSYLNGGVEPGESTTFNVTVGNAEDETVDLDPHVVLPQVQGRPIDDSWITVEDADTTLDPGEEREFTITVETPEDAELGSYNAHVAFTNQTVSYPGTPERPVHSAQISVTVEDEPSVTIGGDRYGYSQIQTGSSYTYEFTVENEGDETVPLNPQIRTNDNVRSDQNTVERSWFDIESPNEVAPGETANVNITVTPAANAAVGDYSTQVDLGLTDPDRPDRSDYWQQVHLDFRVWEQPENPFEKRFSVSEAADDVTLSLTASAHRETATDEPVSFDVTFVSPNGTDVDAERLSVTDSGSVSLGAANPRDAETQGSYADSSAGTEFEYRVEDPESGEWTAEILPENAIDFRYEIVRNESDS